MDIKEKVYIVTQLKALAGAMLKQEEKQEQTGDEEELKHSPLEIVEEMTVIAHKIIENLAQLIQKMKI